MPPDAGLADTGRVAHPSLPTIVPKAPMLQSAGPPGVVYEDLDVEVEAGGRGHGAVGHGMTVVAGAPSNT